MPESILIEEQKERNAGDCYPNQYTPIVPNGKRCQFTGLGHGRLYQLLDGPAKGKVRVASLRHGDATRGTRLFHVGDMLRYLDSLAAKNT